MRWRSGTVTFRSMKKASRTGPEGFERCLHVCCSLPAYHDGRCGRPRRESRRTRASRPGSPSRSLFAGSYRLLRSKRYVVLHSLLHTPNLADQVSEVAALLDEINRRAVDHEKRSLCILMKERPVRLDQPFEILLRDAPLESPVALP